MKKLPLFLMLISVAFFVEAQEPDSVFDLKSYTTTNYFRSSLDLNVSFDESTNSSLNKVTVAVDPDRKGFLFNSAANVSSTYSSILFNDKEIVKYGGELNLNNRSRVQKSLLTDSLETVSRKFDYNGNNTVNGYYNRSGYYSSSSRNFYKLGGSASFGVNQTVSRTDDDINPEVEDKNGPNYTAEVLVNAGHGHGRIENVEDAVEAMYILSDLSKAGLLSRNYTSDDVKALADQITLVQKERYFDVRLYQAKAMKELFSLLTKFKLIQGESIDVYSVLNDYHFMAGMATRSSGQQLAYYLTPGITFESRKYSNYERSETFTKRLGASVEYLNSKPISMKWQRDLNINMNLAESWVKTANSNRFEGKLVAGYAIGYFPNTRTNLRASIYATFNHSSTSGYFESDEFTTSLNFSAYYYLSERLRLSGNLGLHAEAGRSEGASNDVVWYRTNNSGFYQHLQFVLAYYIF
ncbi:MAG TPA: hypothetical protein PKH79_08115 [Prolixibacteraceae bacterium]|nr:hypothetical protein [Prolixibacteraceae bacterium]